MKIRIIKVFMVLALLTIIQLMGGCADVYQSIIDGLAKANCKANADPKVNDKLRVLLYAKHHIFVGGKSDANGKWLPNENTTHPYSKYKWKNSDLVTYRESQIKAWMPKVNDIFKKNDANIYIYNTDIDVRVDPQMFPTSAGHMSGALGHTSQVVSKIQNDEPQYLHVIWGWTNNYAAVAVGSNFYVVIADDPKSGDKADYKNLAHEFVHAFGYNTHDNITSNNLMDDYASGEKLTKSQINIIWNYINQYGKKLNSLTCDK